MLDKSVLEPQVECERKLSKELPPFVKGRKHRGRKNTFKKSEII